MSSSNITLTLAVPAFNEKAIIQNTINELTDYMATEMSHVSCEIIVIDDGSTDGMSEALDEAAAKQQNLRVVHHPKNYGRGRGVITAMEACKSDYLIMLDADLSYAPDHIPALLEPLINEGADITVASPYHKDGRVENVPFTRATLSRVGNWLLTGSFDTKISTVTCIVRGYTKNVIEQLTLHSTGKELHLELLYKAEILGLNIHEVPARLIWRDPNRHVSSKKGVGRVLSHPLIKMRHVIVSHFLFNFLAKPKLLFIVPILIGLLLFSYGGISLFSAYIDRLAEGQSNALRRTLIDGQLTLIITILSFIITMFLMLVLFIASQAKRYFKEQYILSSRTYHLLKSIERTLDKEREK